MSEAINWRPREIVIEQRGMFTWDWSVRGDGYGVKTGMCLTRSGAIRKAKRYRKGVLVDG